MFKRTFDQQFSRPEKDQLNYETKTSLKNMYKVYDTADVITNHFSRKQREHLIFALTKSLETEEMKEHIMSIVSTLYEPIQHKDEFKNRVSLDEMRQLFHECCYMYDHNEYLEYKERKQSDEPDSTESESA